MPPPETKNPPPVAAGEGRIASDFGKRLNRYGTAKNHTSALIKAIGPDRAKTLRLPFTRITECGDWMKFRHYYTVAQIKLAGASFCMKHLVCSLCAIRRASRLMASYLERYSVIRKAQPELSAHLATLTVKNSHDLAEVLEHLLDSLRLLNRRRNNKRQPSIMHTVQGGVYSVELTHDKETGWHPHVHAIWLSADPAMFDQAATFRLRDEWKQITGDSFMCDIRAIRAEQQISDDIDPHAGGFAEVFKYAMKPSELGADRLIEALPHLLGKRLIGSFGLFRGVPEPDSLADDLTGLDDLPYYEFLARFLRGQYHKDGGSFSSA